MLFFMTGTYHHGSLRETFLRLAGEAIRQGGLGSLSLRSLAQAAGVSPMALYRHFKDKNDLVVTLMRRNYDQFNEYLAAGYLEAGNPGNALMLMGQRYFAYALGHPEEYRLLFGASLPKADYPADLKEVSLQSFNRLESLLKDTGHAHPRPAALGIWTRMHGLVMLYLDRKLPDEFLPDRFDWESLFMP